MVTKIVYGNWFIDGHDVEAVECAEAHEDEELPKLKGFNCLFEAYLITKFNISISSTKSIN